MFEPFKRPTAKSGPRVNTPQIRIEKTGRIVLNRAARDHFQEHRDILILWDAAARRLALQRAEPSANTFRLSPMKSSMVFSAVIFLREIGLMPREASEAYPATWNEAEQRLEASFSHSSFEQLQALIDAPLPPTDQLRRTLKTKAPWDK